MGNKQSSLTGRDLSSGGMTSLLRGCVRAAAVAWKRANDRWLNIDTLTVPAMPVAASGSLTSALGDNFAFSSVDYWDVRRIVSRVQLAPEEVVYEIGAGLGRVVCLFGRQKIRKVVAVELNPILAERIRKNAQSLRGRRCPVEVTCADAATATLEEGTLFFFFNPFGADTLSAVLSNIKRSIDSRPRAIRLIYVNPQPEHAALFAGQPWLSDAGRMRTLHGLEVRLFRADPQFSKVAAQQ
jgi:SAM-dependent methyltransferase